MSRVKNPAVDQAIADKKAQVSVVAYDLNEPDVVARLEKLKKRLMVIIDNDGAHGKDGSAENEAERRLVASAGRKTISPGMLRSATTCSTG